MRFIRPFATLALAPFAAFADTTTDLATLPFPELAVRQSWGEARSGASADGNPLRVAGKTYASGIGTHANSEWTLPVNGAATSLSGACGVDDETDAKASVRFFVEGDGKILWKSPVMRKGDAAAPFTVPLAGVKTLRLLVDDAKDGVTGDHADWLDLRLTHSGEVSDLSSQAISVATSDLEWTFAVNNGRLEQRRFGPKSSADRSRAPAVYAFPDYIDRNADIALMEPTLDILGADGLRNLALRFVSKEVSRPEPGVTRTDIRLKDAVTGTGLDLHFLAYEKENVIEAWSTIRNGSGTPVTLLRADSFSFSVSGKDLHLTTFRGGWGDEMNWIEARSHRACAGSVTSASRIRRTDTARVSSSAGVRPPRRKAGSSADHSPGPATGTSISRASSTTPCAHPAASARSSRSASPPAPNSRRRASSSPHPTRARARSAGVSTAGRAAPACARPRSPARSS